MVISNYSWEDETRKYIALSKAELNDVEKQMAELQGRRTILAREVESLEIALESHLRRTGKQRPIDAGLRELLEAQINQKERIKRLAETNGNMAKVGPISDTLFNMGFIHSKNRNNAYKVVYSLLLEMEAEGVFKKVAPAMFQLVGAQQSLLNDIRAVIQQKL